MASRRFQFQQTETRRSTPIEAQYSINALTDTRNRNIQKTRAITARAHQRNDIESAVTIPSEQMKLFSDDNFETTINDDVSDIATSISQNKVHMMMQSTSMRAVHYGLDGKLRNDSEMEQKSAPMSLDVLAQVASATLATDHSVRSSKITMRSVQSLDSLRLDQIQRLSDKALVNLFTTASYDEIKRNYSLTCQLMPATCSDSYTSFGNEQRAKSLICVHLRRHLSQLAELERNDPSHLPFTAVPVPTISKMKKAVEKSVKNLKRKRPSQRIQSKNVGKLQLAQGTRSQSPTFTVLRPLKSKPKDVLVVSKGHTVDVSGIVDGKNQDDEDTERNTYDSMDAVHTISRTTTDATGGPEADWEFKGIKVEVSNEQSTTLELNEHDDHNYSSKTGTKRSCADLADVCDDEDDDDELRATHVSMSVPLPPISPSSDVEPSEPSTSQHRPYPPMPKYDLAKRGKVVVREEIASSGDEGLEAPNKQRNGKRKRAKPPKEGSQEWERRTALKCIRELRARKKDEWVPLICKICQDRAFTAAATLTYHYRSHAGIKPFVCLICNTTFTRQHSLNYHMLIHNNQSRFSCPECLRKFRHPSHFKEHMRRHTGETPFVCTDCPVRFKTRNTYKRHLKTRHGKLLTATGIHRLSTEDAKRCQTKPYKRRLTTAQATAQSLIEHLNRIDIEVDDPGAKDPGGHAKKARERKFKKTTESRIISIMPSPLGPVPAQCGLVGQPLTAQQLQPVQTSLSGIVTPHATQITPVGQTQTSAEGQQANTNDSTVQNASSKTVARTIQVQNTNVQVGNYIQVQPKPTTNNIPMSLTNVQTSGLVQIQPNRLQSNFATIQPNRLSSNCPVSKVQTLTHSDGQSLVQTVAQTQPQSTIFLLSSTVNGQTILQPLVQTASQNPGISVVQNASIQNVTTASSLPIILTGNQSSTFVLNGQQVTLLSHPLTPATTLVSHPLTPATTLVSHPLTPATTLVSQPLTSATTQVSQPLTPATTLMSQPLTPATTLVSQPLTPATILVSPQLTPTTTLVSQSLTPATTLVSQPRTSATTLVSQPLTPATALVPRVPAPNTSLVSQPLTTATTPVSQHGTSANTGAVPVSLTSLPTASHASYTNSQSEFASRSLTSLSTDELSSVIMNSFPSNQTPVQSNQTSIQSNQAPVQANQAPIQSNQTPQPNLLPVATNLVPLHVNHISVSPTLAPPPVNQTV